MCKQETTKADESFENWFIRASDIYMDILQIQMKVMSLYFVNCFLLSLVSFCCIGIVCTFVAHIKYNANNSVVIIITAFCITICFCILKIIENKKQKRFLAEEVCTQYKEYKLMLSGLLYNDIKSIKHIDFESLNILDHEITECVFETYRAGGIKKWIP